MPEMVDQAARWREIQAMSDAIVRRDEPPTSLESALVGAVLRAREWEQHLSETLPTQPVNNALTRLIDKMHDAVLDTDASGRHAGNLMDVWMALKANIEPSSETLTNAAPQGVGSAARVIDQDSLRATQPVVAATGSSYTIPGPWAPQFSVEDKQFDKDCLLPSAEALRLAREFVEDPDLRAQVKVKIAIDGHPLIADMIDEAVVMAREIIRLAEQTPSAKEPTMPPMAVLAAQGAFRCAEQFHGLLQECDEAFSKSEVDAALVIALGYDSACVFRERVRDAITQYVNVSPTKEKS